jgi:thiol:disulfide interchange protein
MITGSGPFEFLGAFAAGVLVSFSPCVYPLLPITIGYIGSSSQKDKFHAFLLSLIYVLGMAITYSVLGVFASLTGKIFGQISSHPASYFVIGNICIIFGLSMLGLFELHMPEFFLNKMMKRRKSKLSVFLLGVTSGLIVGPCTSMWRPNKTFFTASFYYSALLTGWARSSFWRGRSAASWSICLNQGGGCTRLKRSAVFF